MITRLTRRRIRRAWMEAFMNAKDTAYLNWVLNQPLALATMTGIISAMSEYTPEPVFTANGQVWRVSFSTKKPRQGLRTAELDHPHLKIKIREQNPYQESYYARLKLEGHDVYQVFVNNQPCLAVIDSETYALDPHGGCPAETA